jgi:hypothetical protein
MTQSTDYSRPDWIFRMWSISPTHNQLILRSDPMDDARRAEVYFGNIQLMFLHPVLHGLHVRRATRSELGQLKQVCGIPPDWEEDGVFLLSPSGLDFVVSGNPAWREAVRDFDAPSLFDFDQPWPPSPEVSWGTVA